MKGNEAGDTRLALITFSRRSIERVRRGLLGRLPAVLKPFSAVSIQTKRQSMHNASVVYYDIYRLYGQ